MAGRIRTIKPEFWSSESITELTIPARLLFIGMWNFVDDAGNHPASAKTLKLLIYPNGEFTTEQVSEMVAEMITLGLVISYEGPDSKEYWHITGWARHQRIDRPNYRYPAPNSTNNRRILDEQSATDPRPIATVRECNSKGEERKGREFSNAHAHEGEFSLTENNEPADPPLDQFAQLYDTIQTWGDTDAGHQAIIGWKKRTGYRDSQHGPTTDELAKFISYHLSEKNTPENRAQFCKTPVQYFIDRFPGWLTNAKSMNRPPNRTHGPKQTPPNNYKPPPSRPPRSNSPNTGPASIATLLPTIPAST